MQTIETTTRARRPRVEECPFCRRRIALTFHHLIPKRVHRRRAYKRRYSRTELARGVYLCRDCHDGIHASYSELELATSYNTPESLAADPVLSRHFAWVARQRRNVGQGSLPG